MGHASWFRQFTTLLTKNHKHLLRQPSHLINLLLNSIPAVLLAYAAGRDARAPQGDFPPLTACGQVDPEYYIPIYEEAYWAVWDIPMSMNEAWRSALPVWIMSLGATFSAISVFFLLRTELASKRLGMMRSAGLRDSVYWSSWLVSFGVCAVINSLFGATTAAVLPNVHVLEHVNFWIVFALLLFLNLALVAASFLLAAACGTVQSTTLSVFLIIGMICAGASPVIKTSVTSAYLDVTDSMNTYSLPSGDAGAFWGYGSTERTSVQYLNSTYNNETYGDDPGEPSLSQCQLPILSHEQGHFMKTAPERDLVSKEEIFLGCYVLPGASTTLAHNKVSYFFWYWLPQTHFLMAWSNILGYTALPGNDFSFSQAVMSSEVLATESLSNHLHGKELKPTLDTNGTSLFPQGSTVNTMQYYPHDSWSLYQNDEPMSNCPSKNVLDNLCIDSYCDNAEAGYPSISSPSVNQCIGLLASLVAVYTIMASYACIVFSMGNGAALKFYFPLQPSYWSAGRRDGCERSLDDVEEGISTEGESKEGMVGVEVINVRKNYGKVEALKPLSLKLNVGEVTSLLGHNGAGKSTLVNLICCEQNASDGDILVFGKSVKSHASSVRSLLGQCKQDDYLWPFLSAKDHLMLFAGIRGLSVDEVSTTVQSWLESVDLDIVQENYTSTFSGGMKRRLSVALSTIGPSKLIVLDEPTTGMDPISRRYVWNHITAIKPGRVILLTTHAMEEADLLSDSVAIICDGSLVASGTPLQLKHQYGTAIQFSLIAGKHHVEEVEVHIKSHFAGSHAWVDVKSSDSGYLTLSVKKVKQSNNGEGVDSPLLSTFIGWLEEEDCPVQEFSISNSSLEEVFLAVTKEYHVDQSRAAENENRRRRCCPCCCGLKQPAQTSDEVTNQVSHSRRGLNLVDQPKTTLAEYARNLSVRTQTIALLRFYMKRNWTGRPSIINWVIYGTFCVGNTVMGFALVVMWQDFTMYYMLLLTVFLLSMILISIISPIYSDRHLGLHLMMQTQSMLDKSFILGTYLYATVVSLGYTAVVLTLFFATKIYRHAETPDCSLDDNGNTDMYDWCGRADFGTNPIVHPTNRIQVLSGEYNGEDVAVFAHQGSGGYGMIFGIIIVFSLTLPGAVLTSSFFPGFRIPLVVVSLLLLVACLSPAVLFTANIIDPYFMSKCTEAVGNEYIDCSQYSFDLENANSTFVECVGLSIASQYVYCSLTYASLLPQIGLFHTLSLSLMSDVVFYSEPEGYASKVFVPGLEGASCRGTACSFEYAKLIYLRSLGYMFLGSVALLIIGVAIAYCVLYPSAFLIRSRHKFRDIMKSWIESEAKSSSSEENELEEIISERQLVNSLMKPILEDPAISNNSDVTSDVVFPILSHQLRNRIQEQLPLVITHRLRKVFPSLGKSPPKVALVSLDLHVERGQVLGLLGKNGAGKTTALKILAAMDSASSGIGLVAGFDVETERIAVYERLGNCPQFDCVWKAQSVQSHLEFYARLKGISDPVKAAKEIASAVGLGSPDVYSRPSGNLSGGMRRRLSIAISLVGAPKVLCLDEPTTGLDPSTRNEIWSLISSFASPERAVIITTHMMIEADTLCNRIAIVSNGRLKVIGTQQHLKNNYGSGYLLQLNLLRSNEQSADLALEFVKDHIHEDARIVIRQAKTIGINLPRAVSIQKIFTKMYSEGASEVGINQFLLSQSSLEDVFISLQ